MPPVSAGARETQPKESPCGSGAPASRSGADGGGIVAYASIFDREPDSYGDVVARGAFADTLEVWWESGRPIPLLFGHNMDDPDARKLVLEGRVTTRMSTFWLAPRKPDAVAHSPAVKRARLRHRW